MNETVAALFREAITEAETELSFRVDCCGCSRGEVEDRLERLRTLVDIYSDGPKRPGY